jgi:hypothetical protein
MGVNVSTATNIETQESINDFYQSASEECYVTCSATQGGQFIVITGSTVGDIAIQNSCSAVAECSMTNSLSSLSTQSLSSDQTSEAQNSPQSFFSWPAVNVGTTTNYIDQTLDNTITQILTSSCTASSQQLQENVTIDIANSTVGDISVANTGQATAACSMNNTASIVSYATGSSTQTATSKNGRSIGLYGFIILAIIAIAVIVYLIYREKYKTQLKQTEEQQKVELARLAVQAKLASSAPKT